jgi:hypothetical protein
MGVPDDITLLWTEDNWRNIRRLSIPSKTNRSGGAGVYYVSIVKIESRSMPRLTKPIISISIALEVLAIINGQTPENRFDHVDQYHSTAEDMGVVVPGLCKTGQNYLDCQRWRSRPDCGIFRWI